eukprot:scaffold1310_cov219-Ochromonas_danica.AAC.5
MQSVPRVLACTAGFSAEKTLLDTEIGNDDCVSTSGSVASSEGSLLEVKVAAGGTGGAGGGARVKRVDAQGMARMYASLWGLPSISCARPERYAEEEM